MINFDVISACFILSDQKRKETIKKYYDSIIFLTTFGDILYFSLKICTEMKTILQMLNSV